MNAQNVTQILDALAAKLSVPASHLWEVLIRQVRVGIVFDVLWLVAAIILLRLIVTKAWKAADNTYDAALAKILLCIPAAIAFVVIIISAHGIVTAVFNPEYAALKLIFDAVSAK